MQLIQINPHLHATDRVDVSRDGAAATARGLGGKADSLDLGTPYEYAEAHLPRFATMPWSARVFDSRSVTADPILLCMSTGAGTGAQGEYLDASCTCLTEQGTRYDISDGECRRVARYGTPHNPYRATREVMQPPGQQQSAAVQVHAPAPDGYTSGQTGATAGRPLVDRPYGTITRPRL